MEAECGNIHVGRSSGNVAQYWLIVGGWVVGVDLMLLWIAELHCNKSQIFEPTLTEQEMEFNKRLFPTNLSIDIVCERLVTVMVRIVLFFMICIF